MKRQSTIRGAAYITIGRILSKIIGVFRERLFAVYFGTSYVVDVFKLGVSIFGIITGAVITPILRYASPNITQAYEEENLGHIKHNTQVILLLAGSIGLLLSGLLMLFPKQIIHWFLPYIYNDPVKLSVASAMFVLIGLMSALYVLITIFEQLLVSIHIYTHLGIKDPLINTIWTTVVAISPAAMSIVWGRILGALAYFILVLYLSYKAIGYMKKHFNHRGAPSRKALVKDIFVGTLPLYIGGSMSLINQFIDRTMAGYLGEGNIAIIGYGSVVAGIVGSLMINPFVQSVYPKVSAYIRQNNKEGFLKESHHITEIALFFSIPSVIALFTISYRVAFFFFGSNKIGGNTLTTIGIISALMAYVQLLSLAGVYTSAFIPMKRTDIGMKISLFVVPLNILLNYILAFTMGMGAVGLKLATAISVTIGNFTSLYVLSKLLGGLELKNLLPSTIKTLIASLAMVVFIYPLDKLLPQTRVFTLLIVFIGATVHFTVSYIEGHEVLDRIVEKIGNIFSSE